jgi:Zn-dependent alcohol dehydrogenase
LNAKETCSVSASAGAGAAGWAGAAVAAGGTTVAESGRTGAAEGAAVSGVAAVGAEVSGAAWLQPVSSAATLKASSEYFIKMEQAKIEAVRLSKISDFCKAFAADLLTAINQLIT